MSVILLILGLLLFVSLVVVHELGHFIAARRNGVDVEEFGIGFPPRAWKKHLKGGVLFTLNWLPLGGFVRLKGEHDADKGKGTYGAASLKAKTKIMLAGVAMNLIVAWAMFILIALIGMPRLIDNQFSVRRDAHTVKQEVLTGYVEPDSPAQKAGLQERDKLVSVLSGNKKYEIKSSNDLITATHANPGAMVLLTFEHNGQSKATIVQLRTKEDVDQSLKTDNPKGYLGIAPAEFVLQRYTWSAPIQAAGVIGQFTKLTFQGVGSALASLFSGNTAKASQQVSGPVGIVVLLRDGSLLGIQFILMIIAVISLTLAIMNILPIPALDGGRLFVTLLFHALKKPLTRQKEEWIHGSGFAVLITLFILITIVDVKRFF